MERETYFDGYSYQPLSSEVECVQALGKLEDAEEQGCLVVLPCKVGNTVFEPSKRGFISTYRIISVHFSACSTLIGWELIEGIYSNVNGFELSALGKTVFLTREEAENAMEDTP